MTKKDHGVEQTDYSTKSLVLNNQPVKRARTINQAESSSVPTKKRMESCIDQQSSFYLNPTTSRVIASDVKLRSEVCVLISRLPTESFLNLS